MTHIDHVTFRTSKLAATRQFFIDLFDLVEGPRPKQIHRIPGHWLYAGDDPIVHLIGSFNRHPHLDGEIIDHIAFGRSGYEDFVGRLMKMQIPYSTMSLIELGEHRLFLRAPGGQLIEVVFRGADAQRAFQAGNEVPVT